MRSSVELLTVRIDGAGLLAPLVGLLVGAILTLTRWRGRACPRSSRSSGLPGGEVGKARRVDVLLVVVLLLSAAYYGYRLASAQMFTTQPSHGQTP